MTTITAAPLADTRPVYSVEQEIARWQDTVALLRRQVPACDAADVDSLTALAWATAGLLEDLRALQATIAEQLAALKSTTRREDR